jgi:hypothetical protein
MELDFKPISKKIEELIKKRIKDLGLVKTGTLLDSISVSTNGVGSFEVTAEDYYTALDAKYNISNYALESDELTQFIEDEIAKQLQKEINK